jgi:membrane protein
MKESASKKSGIGTFFSTTLWEMDPDGYRGIRRYGVKYLQIIAMVAKEFRDDSCLLHASALTFTTILSLVPFFALTFALLKGLGVQNKLEPFILEQVTAGSQELVDKIITYINNTNMTSLGAVGLAALIVTVITLLGNIEEAFNVIWGVRETRSLYRKFSDYLSVLMSGPLLMLAAISITTSLQSQSLVRWLMETTYLGDLLLFFFRLVPYVSVWLALFFLYIFIPNTKVRFRSALLGGVLAGTIWQLAQWGYLHFQVGVAKYNAIYGTLSLLPVFMVWIYTSWLIVLFGLEIVSAHQNIKTFRREYRTPQLSHAMKELLTLTILQDIATAFHFGCPAPVTEQLAEELDIPVRVVRELVTQLTETGYLVATAGDEPSYQPARELEQISVNEVLLSLKDYGGSWGATGTVREEALMRGILARVNSAAAATLAGMTLKDLVAPSAAR